MIGRVWWPIWTKGPEYSASRGQTQLEARGSLALCKETSICEFVDPGLILDMLPMRALISTRLSFHPVDGQVNGIYFSGSIADNTGYPNPYGDSGNW